MSENSYYNNLLHLPKGIRGNLSKNLSSDIDNELKGVTLGKALEGMIELFYKQLLMNDGKTSNKKWKKMDLDGKIEYIGDLYDSSLKTRYHRVRKIRNISAHYSEKEISNIDIEEAEAIVSDCFYDVLCIYFQINKFGSNNPVMTALSILPAQSRVEVLSRVYLKEKKNLNVIDKLSMAYLKSGNEDLAKSFINDAYKNGNIDGDMHNKFITKLNDMKPYIEKFDISKLFEDSERKMRHLFKSELYTKDKEFVWVLLTLLFDKNEIEALEI